MFLYHQYDPTNKFTDNIKMLVSFAPPESPKPLISSHYLKICITKKQVEIRSQIRCFENEKLVCTFSILNVFNITQFCNDFVGGC